MRASDAVDRHTFEHARIVALACVEGVPRVGYGRCVNLNLNVFWTLVVVIVVAPLATLALACGCLMVAILCGYDAT
jgi:hypothetical protein